MKLKTTNKQQRPVPPKVAQVVHETIQTASTLAKYKNIAKTQSRQRLEDEIISNLKDLKSLPALLFDPDAGVVKTIAHVIGSLTFSGISIQFAVPSLVAVLDHEDSEVRSSAVWALMHASEDVPASAIPKLNKLILDENSLTRSCTYTVLNALVRKDVDISPAIDNLYAAIPVEEDPENALNLSALLAVFELTAQKGMNVSRALPDLQRIFAVHLNDDSDICSKAASTISSIANTDANAAAFLPTLISLLDHENDFLRFVASRSLLETLENLIQNLGEKAPEADLSDAISALKKLHFRENSHIAENTAHTLKEAALHGLDISSNFPEMIKALSDDRTHPNVLAWDAWALAESARHGTDIGFAVPALFKSLMSGIIDVRHNGIMALAEAAKQGHTTQIVDMVVSVHDSTDFQRGALRNNEYFIDTSQTLGRLLQKIQSMEEAA